MKLIIDPSLMFVLQVQCVLGVESSFFVKLIFGYNNVEQSMEIA